LALSKSTSNLSKLTQSKKICPDNFSNRALEWKRSKDLKIESKRKQKEKDEVSQYNFIPTINKKSSTNFYANHSKIHQRSVTTLIKASESLCPVLKAGKIEKRARMRMKLSKRNKSKKKVQKVGIELTQKYSLKGNLAQG